MLCRSILAMVLLLGLVAQADAQEQAPRARLVGTVTSRYGPTAEALIELLRGTVAVRTDRTRVDGRFEFADVPTGEYRLRVRRLGFSAHEQQIRVPAAGDSVHVTLRDASVAQDSILQAEYERQLAAARSRPRRWSCRVSARDVRTTAVTTYEQFSGRDTAKFLENAHKYGMPRTREAYLRDFRSVRDARECRRLAEAIVRQHGLLSDRLRVFRTGKVYFVPDFGDGGMIVGLDGTILAMFIVPS